MKGEIQRASENVRRKAEEESKRVRKKEESRKREIGTTGDRQIERRR